VVISNENLKRPKDEFDFLMNLFEKEFEEWQEMIRYTKTG